MQATYNPLMITTPNYKLRAFGFLDIDNQVIFISSVQVDSLQF